MLFLAVGCSDKDEIVFDHEKPAFETKDGMILLEVIAPNGTKDDDQIYICGPFNGDTTAVGNTKWQLEKSSTINLKWGVYLDPSSFVAGKTLSDGFYFISAKEGTERTVFNKGAIHYLDAAVGTRTNVYVDRWASYFSSEEPTVKHDGYTIYVDDQTGWDALTLYMWGDKNDLNGGWPGMAVTGKQKIGSTTYKYFDMGADNKDLTENLIFNNNGGGTQLKDFKVKLNRDYYLKITADGVTEISMLPEHSGVRIYAINETTWGTTLTLYQWGKVNDLGGGWPGMAPSGTATIYGRTYSYYEYDNTSLGLAQNLIFNNNGGGTQLKDVAVTLAADNFLRVTDKGATVIDPMTGEDVVAPTPTPDPTPATGYKVYFEDKTGWSAIAAYAWGDSEIFGGWPGKQAEGTETVDSKTYSYLNVALDNAGKTEHLIFNNNNGGTQLDGFDLVMNKNHYLTVTAAGVTEVDVAQSYRIFVQDSTSHSLANAYGYDTNGSVTAGWPGLAANSTKVKINGKEYLEFDFSKDLSGKAMTLILNGSGQIADFPITLNKDFYLVAKDSGAKEIKP